MGRTVRRRIAAVVMGVAALVAGAGSAAAAHNAAAALGFRGHMRYCDESSGHDIWQQQHNQVLI